MSNGRLRHLWRNLTSWRAGAPDRTVWIGAVCPTSTCGERIIFDRTRPEPGPASGACAGCGHEFILIDGRYLDQNLTPETVTAVTSRAQRPVTASRTMSSNRKEQGP